jgi:F-box/leucine-rich repeat protein 10/11
MDGSKWIRILETKEIKPNSFKRMKGSEVNVEWVEQDPDALKEPIIIEKPDGLGMRMPQKGFAVADVAEIVGPDTPLEVIGGCYLV